VAQDVLRRWYSSNPAILSNVHDLVANAHAMEAALRAADVARVGACVSAYWEQKKKMCDAEPEAVTRMLAKVRPLVHGATLAGAGGGGFMLLVTREPDMGDAIAAALKDEQCVVHEVAIDTVGLRTRILPA
jgi:fucokinase